MRRGWLANRILLYSLRSSTTTILLDHMSSPSIARATASRPSAPGVPPELEQCTILPSPWSFCVPYRKAKWHGYYEESEQSTQWCLNIESLCERGTKLKGQRACTKRYLHRRGSERLFRGRKRAHREICSRAVIACMLPEGMRGGTWLIDSHKALGMFPRYWYTGRKPD